ncbi:MAG: indolepyruvate ferredoxin oxidoreductase subunit alpha [Chitinophagales bacterium]
MKKLLNGNEAIAWGAVEAGVGLATSYPGTPSTEIFTTLAELAPRFGYHAEWCVNEKVAFEVAFGAAMTGVRSIVSMKQVGLNVAADPLMTGAYLGVKGGMVIAVADDPGPHSSQNEQDTRAFGRFAKVPVLDPSSPREAKEMVKQAFEISEQYGVPVILRTTTRVAHVGQDVEVSENRIETEEGWFRKDPQWVIFPSLATVKHGELLKKLEALQGQFEVSNFNLTAEGTGKGVIASGIAYNYFLEAMSSIGVQVPVLKIGTAFPLPEKIIADFLRNMEEVLILEELDPYLEDEIARIAHKNEISTLIKGKHTGQAPYVGEYNVDIVRRSLCSFLKINNTEDIPYVLPDLPGRRPILCAGCPHRASFYALKKAAGKEDMVFTGDIGCYTLGVMPPLEMVDTCLCMGACINQAQGIGRADPERKTVAVLGDSTFFHSGVPGLINAVYNSYPLTLVILDNNTTAMTGFQPHPGTGQAATGEYRDPVDLEMLIRGCGVKQVETVDPVRLKESIPVLKESLALDEPSVVILRRPCANHAKGKRLYIEEEKCKNCKICVRDIGCPAIIMESDQKPVISDSCTGCGLCAEICPFDAVIGRD